MFTVDVAGKRVVITHTVKALDGHVDLETTFPFADASEEELLLWAATNRLTRWLTSPEIGRLSSAEVKKQFDHLVTECREDFRPATLPISREEHILVEDLRKLMGDGLSVERAVQSLVRNALRSGH